jgi:hypothetical protein
MLSLAMDQTGHIKHVARHTIDHQLADLSDGIIKTDSIPRHNLRHALQPVMVEKYRNNITITIVVTDRIGRQFAFTWSARSVLAKIEITDSTIGLRLKSLEADMRGIDDEMKNLTAACLTSAPMGHFCVIAYRRICGSSLS